MPQEDDAVVAPEHLGAKKEGRNSKGPALRATAKEAYDRGAFGVPTFFLGTEMFWGNDRIVLLRHTLSGGSGSS